MYFSQIVFLFSLGVRRKKKKDMTYFIFKGTFELTNWFMKIPPLPPPRQKLSKVEFAVVALR